MVMNQDVGVLVNPLEKKGLEKQLNKAYKERKKQKHEKQ